MVEYKHVIVKYDKLDYYICFKRWRHVFALVRHPTLYRVLEYHLHKHWIAVESGEVS